MGLETFNLLEVEAVSSSGTTIEKLPENLNKVHTWILLMGDRISHLLTRGHFFRLHLKRSGLEKTKVGLPLVPGSLEKQSALGGPASYSAPFPFCFR